MIGLDVRRVVRALQIVDDDTLAIGARRHRCADLVAMLGPMLGDDPPLVRALAHAIYSQLYARLRPATGYPRSERALLGELSAANTSTVGWDPGWTVTGFDPDPPRLVVRKDDLSVYAMPGEVAAEAPAVGDVVHLRLGKERLFVSPGFYFALGDARGDRTRDRETVRIYLNVRAEGAAAFVGATTTALNAAGVPFRAKIVSNPNGFVRADAAVIYLARADYAGAAPALRAIRARLRGQLVAATPLFAKRVAPGIAVAEDPASSLSFGQHRSRAIALALVEARSRALAPRAVLALVGQTLAAQRIDPERPHLALGNPDRYDAWN
ncbi:MAG TPA: T3SS effector HopA1 family protein [Kofleriaceae bacterium]|nr:T3SS effector HopA1 family protein [Kofleriaceae bacterium]